MLFVHGCCNMYLCTSPRLTAKIKTESAPGPGGQFCVFCCVIAKKIVVAETQPFPFNFRALEQLEFYSFNIQSSLGTKNAQHMSDPSGRTGQFFIQQKKDKKYLIIIFFIVCLVNSKHHTKNPKLQRVQKLTTKGQFYATSFSKG